MLVSINPHPIIEILLILSSKCFGSVEQLDVGRA